MAATVKLQQEPSIAARRMESEEASRRLGGLIVVEYLMNLFGESPKAFFDRIDVLAVLDSVKNDRSLFPEAVVAISDRIHAA